MINNPHSCAIKPKDHITVYDTGVVTVQLKQFELVGQIQLTPETALILAEDLIEFAKLRQNSKFNDYSRGI